MDVTLAKIEEIENHFIAWTSSVLVPGHVVMRMWWYVHSLDTVPAGLIA